MTSSLGFQGKIKGFFLIMAGCISAVGIAGFCGWQRLSLAFALLSLVALAGVYASFQRRLGAPLEELLSGVRSSTESLLASVAKITQGSQKISDGIKNSAASLAQSASSVEELAAVSQHNAESARQAEELAETARRTAEAGDHEVHTLVGAMEQMADGNRKIQEIISVIDSIAFQTNLLALNAAVEAARAGEQGKGFAVVAEAVRNLAQKSATEAKGITALIHESTNQSASGVRLAAASGTMLSEIVTGVAKVTGFIKEISVASQEQASSVALLGKSLSELDAHQRAHAVDADSFAEASRTFSQSFEALKRQLEELATLLSGSVGESVGAYRDSWHGTAQNNKPTEGRANSKWGTSKATAATTTPHGKFERTAKIKGNNASEKSVQNLNKMSSGGKAKTVPSSVSKPAQVAPHGALDVESIIPFETDEQDVATPAKLGKVEEF